MTAHADEIRDAEILDLQSRVKALEERVKDLEAYPVFVPWPTTTLPPVSPCPLPAYPIDVPHRPYGPHWTDRTYPFPTVWC